MLEPIQSRPINASQNTRPDPDTPHTVSRDAGNTSHASTVADTGHPAPQTAPANGRVERPVHFNSPMRVRLGMYHQILISIDTFQQFFSAINNPELKAWFDLNQTPKFKRDPWIPGKGTADGAALQAVLECFAYGTVPPPAVLPRAKELADALGIQSLQEKLTEPDCYITAAPRRGTKRPASQELLRDGLKSPRANVSAIAPDAGGIASGIESSAEFLASLQTEGLPDIAALLQDTAVPPSASCDASLAAKNSEDQRDWLGDLPDWSTDAELLQVLNTPQTLSAPSQVSAASSLNAVTAVSAPHQPQLLPALSLPNSVNAASVPNQVQPLPSLSAPNVISTAPGVSASTASNPTSAVTVVRATQQLPQRPISDTMSSLNASQQMSAVNTVGAAQQLNAFGPANAVSQPLPLAQLAPLSAAAQALPNRWYGVLPSRPDLTYEPSGSGNAFASSASASFGKLPPHAVPSVAYPSLAVGAQPSVNPALAGLAIPSMPFIFLPSANQGAAQGLQLNAVPISQTQVSMMREPVWSGPFTASVSSGTAQPGGPNQTPALSLNTPAPVALYKQFAVQAPLPWHVRQPSTPATSLRTAAAETSYRAAT